MFLSGQANPGDPETASQGLCQRYAAGIIEFLADCRRRLRT
jgi:hypothetical protein